MTKTIAISLSELLKAGAEKAAEKPSLPIPEVQIATLREAFARYEAGCPFKPGDLVTPRKGFGYTDDGVPHIVLEVVAEPIRVYDISSLVRTCSTDFGERLDIRVISHRNDGDVAAFWQESWRLEPYDGAGVP